MSRKFDKSIEIAATPEQVWEILSSAQGIASWFAPTVTMKPGPDGEVTASWGPGMEGTSQIEIWEPARHLRLGYDRKEGQPRSVVDYFVESQDGATTILRVVQSGFDGPSFDGEFESVGRAWPVFMQMMKNAALRGVAACRMVAVFRMLGESQSDVWKKLSGPDGLGVQGALGTLEAGGAIRLRTAAGESLDGKIWYFDARGFCFFEFGDLSVSVFCEKAGDSAMLTIQLQLFGVSEDKAKEVRERWGGLVDRCLGISAQAGA